MAEAALAREALCALRSEISRLESRNESHLARVGREESWDSAAGVEDARTGAHAGDIVTGADAFDAALGGGIARAALHEIRSAATADNGAASGFALALARLSQGRATGASGRLLWISDPLGAAESGRPYAPGLLAHGMAPESLIHARPRHLKDALMVAEAALAVRSFSAVILEIYGNPAKFALTESRRLNLRARAYRRPIFLLRERGEEEASNAATRLRIGPAPAAPAILPGGRAYAPGLGHPVFHVTVEKSRNPSSPEFFLEWNADECLFRAIEPGRIALPDERPKDSVAVFPLSPDRPDRPDPLGEVVAFSRAS